MSESANRRVGNWYREGKEAKDCALMSSFLCMHLGLCPAGDLRQQHRACFSGIPPVAIENWSYFSTNFHWSLVGYVNLEINSPVYWLSEEEKIL